MKKKEVNQMYLIAEYCDALYYTGWHLYFRGHLQPDKRNDDGSSGWIRRPKENCAIVSFLASLGITIRGDGTCSDDGIAEFARRFPLKEVIGGRRRGGVEVTIDSFGVIEFSQEINK